MIAHLHTGAPVLQRDPAAGGVKRLLRDGGRHDALLCCAVLCALDLELDEGHGERTHLRTCLHAGQSVL